MDNTMTDGETAPEDAPRTETKKPAENGAGRTSPLSRIKGSLRLGEVIASPLLFRSAIFTLLVVALVQWSLIVFNYWR
ncbi:MAG: hypothetical protein AAF698_00760 [Pseudomonadota bacterium]